MRSNYACEARCFDLKKDRIIEDVPENQGHKRLLDSEGRDACLEQHALAYRGRKKDM